jgi:hypothetical protein
MDMHIRWLDAQHGVVTNEWLGRYEGNRAGPYTVLLENNQGVQGATLVQPGGVEEYGYWKRDSRGIVVVDIHEDGPAA